MRNFLHIGSFDPIPTLAALATTDLWNENPLRTQHPGTAHSEVDDIWMMFNRLPENPAEVINDIEVVPYRAWHELPLKAQILDLMRRVDGIGLGRVIITRLAPGKQIYPHTDQGAPAEYYTRYQMVLQSLPGCKFQIGDEEMTFQSGQVYWINNRVSHAVTNNSADDRLVCIADVRRV